MRKILTEFLAIESFGGGVLLVAAVLAFCVSNSAFQSYYHAFFNTPILSFGYFYPGKLNFFTFINEGLMGFFFLLIGLEVKHEMLVGVLNTPAKRMLPGLAAIGGMIVPALIYVAFNLSEPSALRAWAVPTATDVAFSLGFLSLWGSRIPHAAKVFLMALAIFDDLLAMLVIAFFYTHHIDIFFIGLSLLVLLVLACLVWLRIRSAWIYVLLGILLWLCLLPSGVHATLAGVMVALMMPYREQQDIERLKHWMRSLHPWVTYGVLPLFAFANTGFTWNHHSAALMGSPIALGVLFGLLLGKPCGIISICWLGIRCRWARLPTQLQWRTLIGVAFFCGIGFTISLLISLLAFSGADLQNAEAAKLGVLLGSVLSGLTGFVYFYFTLTPIQARKQSHHRQR